MGATKTKSVFPTSEERDELAATFGEARAIADDLRRIAGDLVAFAERIDTNMGELHESMLREAHLRGRAAVAS